MHLGLALAENLGDVFRSGNCEASLWGNEEDELNFKMMIFKTWWLIYKKSLKSVG